MKIKFLVLASMMAFVSFAQESKVKEKQKTKKKLSKYCLSMEGQLTRSDDSNFEYSYLYCFNDKWNSKIYF